MHYTLGQWPKLTTFLSHGEVPIDNTAARSGLALLAGRQATVTTGATIYMPRNTLVGLRNTGSEPLKIVAIFSQPGYEEYLREISVPEGQTPVPLSVEELSAIRARHLDSAVYEKP